MSPSGKLPVSFEREWKDNATFNSYYDNGTKHVKYTEGVFLGYRHFDKSDVKPLFPFGYGLSYTTFKYGNLNVTPTFKKGEPVTVTFDVTNTGSREGAEVGEVYVSDAHSHVPRPVKELKGFGKVDLKARRDEDHHRKAGRSRVPVLRRDQARLGGGAGRLRRVGGKLVGEDRVDGQDDARGVVRRERRGA